MKSNKKSIAIIGAGPAGCMCAYFASQNANVTLFDFAKPLHTLFYTGGGRCNLAYAEYDFKELAKYYPRGEKFLYSVFSKFSTTDTINFFNNIGVKTYAQDDLRIFPVSNSAKEVRAKLLSQLKHCAFKNEKVVDIKKDNDKFIIKTDINSYFFDAVVLALGGHSGFSLAEKLGHKIIEPKPSLTGLITEENFSSLEGVSLKDALAQISYLDKKFAPIKDDILFTHEGISGPLAYKISSVCARLEYSKDNPIIINLNLVNNEFDLQELLNKSPKKDIKNIISELIPKSIAEYILHINKINPFQKGHEIKRELREIISKDIKEFKMTLISPTPNGEIVTSGGVSLNEINPKTMQSKLVGGLYFCGEVIDVDGFCGGFNLQNCWSTGYIAGNNTFCH